MIRGRHVLLLVDRECVLADDPDMRRVVTKTHAPMEYHLARTLRQFGCALTLRAFRSLAALRDDLDALRPDVVFNVTEHVDGTRAHDARIAEVLEQSGVAYTGATAAGLTLCRDKAVSKTIAAMAGVRVPPFAVARTGYPLPDSLPPLPAMVKPVARDSSEGIHMTSIVRTPDALRTRIALVQRRYREPAIVEQFIDGVDVHCGVIETPRLRVLPPRELAMRGGKRAPLVASYHVKHNDDYRARWQVRSIPATLPRATLRRMAHDIATLWPLLALRDYARIDFRLDRDGQLWFIEANPNPGITRRSQCGTWEAVAYPDLVRWILHRALSRGTPASRRR